jgi:transcriptional regulator with XRE-family HTH domain
MGKDIHPAPAAAADDTTAPLALHNEFRRLRLARRESQEKFWSRFGVTQSSGSRFETGMGMPPAVTILLRLYLKGKLSDKDLLA